MTHTPDQIRRAEVAERVYYATPSAYCACCDMTCDWLAAVEAVEADIRKQEDPAGGHWEECDYSAFYSDEAKRGRRRGTYEGRSAVTYERWVPANPDAALLAIVDADTLARLREVAEVTAR